MERIFFYCASAALVSPLGPNPYLSHLHALFSLTLLFPGFKQINVDVKFNETNFSAVLSLSLSLSPLPLLLFSGTSNRVLLFCCCVVVGFLISFRSCVHHQTRGDVCWLLERENLRRCLSLLLLLSEDNCHTAKVARFFTPFRERVGGRGERGEKTLPCITVHKRGDTAYKSRGKTHSHSVFLTLSPMPTSFVTSRTFLPSKHNSVCISGIVAAGERKGI